MIKNRATTLVEIMVYFAILAVFLTAALSFSLQIVNISELSSRIYQLEAESTFVQEKIRTAILSAKSLDTALSVFDSDAGVLTLNMYDAPDDPTVFSLTSGQIFMKEGAAQAQALHSSLLEVSSFRFHKISYDKTPDQVVVDIQFETPSDLANTDADLSLHFTISLRP